MKVEEQPAKNTYLLGNLSIGYLYRYVMLSNEYKYILCLMKLSRHGVSICKPTLNNGMAMHLSPLVPAPPHDRFLGSVFPQPSTDLFIPSSTVALPSVVCIPALVHPSRDLAPAASAQSDI